jgi:hypothetical protein
VFSPQDTQLGESPALLPTHLWSGYFLVEATLEGQGPYVFMLDTGADCMLVSPEIARRLSDQVEASTNSVRGANGDIATSPGVLRVNSLDVGAVRLSGFEALVMDIDQLADALGRHIDGVLGLPLFADCLLTLDYRSEQVWLSDGSLEPADHREILPLKPGRIGEIDAELGGQTITFKIDSGFSREIGLPSSFGLDFARGPNRGSEIVTITGTHQQLEGVLAEDLYLGHHVIRYPSVAINGGSAKLGSDLLRRFAITFDQQNDRVQFARPDGRPLTTRRRRR